MKICIIRNSEGPMNAQLIRIGAALSKTDNDFFFVTRNRDANGEEKVIKKTLNIAGQNYINYEIQLPAMIGGGVKNIVPLMKYNEILYKWLKDNQDKYDAIHAVDYDAGSIALKIKKKYNKKLVYHIADFYAESRLNIPGFLRTYLRKREYNIINNVDSTIICSEDRKEQIAGSHPKNLIVVHNTPPIEQKEPEINPILDKEKLELTYVGGLEKKRFINQVIPIVKSLPDYKLTLAGSIGDARESIAEIPNIDNINFLGKVAYEEALELYKEADIMFAMYDPSHPNHRYSAANKVYEAMLLGKPIIVANNTGMDKIVRSENMGYTIDFNQEAFKDLLIHIKNNRNELLEKSKNAYEAYSRYSWDEMEKRIINLYEKL